jgi:ankyrin repeat protein
MIIRTILIIALWVCCWQPVFGAQPVIVDSAGQACMGEDKSRKQTEQAAMAEAKRKAVERVSTHIQSTTEVKDFQLEKDLVSAYANAEVKIIEETESGWYKDSVLGDCYRVKIKAEIIPAASFTGPPAGLPAVNPERAALDRRGIEYKTENFLKAIKEDNSEIAELFIKAGIDVNAKTKSEGTPALLMAIGKGNIEITKAIIGAGANLNITDNYGTTPLYAASEKGITEVVISLIAGGADVKKNGSGAMVVASRWGFVEIVQAFLNAGVETKGEKAVKAISQAADYGHTSVVKLLLEKGAAVNARDFAGYSPLARAVESNKKETVLLLLDKGADMDNSDKFGMTPLMRAAQKGHTDMVKLLIDKGADKDLKDNDGRTAIMWAVREGSRDSLKILVDAKADINAVDKDGQTALSLARQRKDQNIMNILEKK